MKGGEEIYRSNSSWVTKIYQNYLILKKKTITYSLFFHITFITNQNLIDAFTCMLFDIREPVSYIYNDICQYKVIVFFSVEAGFTG